MNETPRRCHDRLASPLQSLAVERAQQLLHLLGELRVELGERLRVEVSSLHQRAHIAGTEVFIAMRLVGEQFAKRNTSAVGRSLRHARPPCLQRVEHVE